MADKIEALGCVARRYEYTYEVRTPLGTVSIYDVDGDDAWQVQWWPKGQRRASLVLTSDRPTPADAAREATRRLRAIQRTCARAGAL